MMLVMGRIFWNCSNMLVPIYIYIYIYARACVCVCISPINLIWNALKR